MDNVFQMLAQQELDRPRRKLQDLQLQQEEMKLKSAQDEQAYQQKFKTAMAPQPEQPLSLASLGDPTAVNVPNSPMQPKQPTIVDQFKQQYDFHLVNGRTDLAQQVMDHQIDLSTKAAKVAEHAYKMGGKEGLAAWLQANPAFAPLLGDPAHMKFDKEGVLFPASDDKGQPVPNMFWYRDAEGKPQFKEVKPAEKIGDTSGFQSAISGLSGPSAADVQYGLGTTGVKTGYAPLPEVEKDIRMAGSSYGVKGEEINKAVDDARNMYKETYVQGQRTKPKGSKNGYTPEYNLMGQQKDVGKTTDISVNVNNGGGGDEDVAAWAKAVKEGRATLQDVPNRGTVRSRVVKLIESGGGSDYIGNKAEGAAYSSTLTQQTKQAGSMGSFVKNLDAQIGRVGQIGAELSTFDNRLANMPLRYVRKTIMGSPEQSKYEMYLAEIESEIGKLSSGSTGSVAELSQGARQKWEKIIDPNISINGMLKILQEVKHAGELRMKSVTDQINETKSARQNRGKQAPVKASGKSDPLGIL